MAEANKKISFGFSKSVKKPTLLNQASKEQPQVDYVECIDDQTIKSVNPTAEPEETGPRVIPLLGSKTWHERFTNKINADIYNSNGNKKDEESEVVVIKQEPEDNVSITNGDIEVPVKLEPQEIKVELDETNSQLTLDQMAARELIQDLEQNLKKEPTKISTIPLAVNDLVGSEEAPLRTQIRNLQDLVQEAHILIQNCSNSSSQQRKPKYKPRSYRAPRSSSYNDVCVVHERHNSFLTEKEYEVLEKFILDTAKAGFSWRFAILFSNIKFIVREHGRAPLFSSHWMENYISTKSNLTTSKSQVLRKLKVDTPAQKETWCQDLKSYLESKNGSDIAYQRSRTFYCGPIDVFTYPFNVLATFSSDGSALPTLVTYSDKSEVPIQPPRSVNDWTILASNYSGVSIDNLYHYFIMVLHPYLCQRKIKFPVIIFLDGRKFAISVKLWRACEELGIILYCLPPNMLKPIHQNPDAIFQQCSNGWMEMASFYQQNNSWYFMIGHFVSLFERVFNSVVNSESIRYTFRHRDIFIESVFKQEKVLNIFSKEVQDKTVTYKDYIATKKVIEHFVGEKQAEAYVSMWERKVNHQGQLYLLWKRAMDIATSTNPQEFDVNANEIPAGQNFERSKEEENWENDKYESYHQKTQNKRKRNSYYPMPCGKKMKMR